VNRSSYYIDEQPSLKKSLKGIPKGIFQDFKEKAYPQLRENPSEGHNIIKLRPPYIGEYRYTKGNYRLIYSIDGEEGIVNIIEFGHRSSIYK